MKISTKSYYGMLACVYLAKQDGVTSLQDIAKHEKIPQDFLEKILQQLKKSDVVEAKQGVHGGYKLSKKAADITAADIIQTLEGSFTPFNCVGGEHKETSCPKESMCGTKEVWQKLDESISSTLQSITLAELTK